MCDRAPRIGARMSVTLPGARDPALAEAWGCRAALELLLSLQGAPRVARIVGDNLLVVRFGAGGRLRHAEAHGLLEPCLARACAAGRTIRWVAVPREFNSVADGAAVASAHRARARLALGHRSPHLEVQWHPDEQGSRLLP